jgi:glutathione synthase/RimK-type ligase-like ATP-grasp enzyme
MPILHVTSARDTTTDLVIRELGRRNAESVRINTESFPVNSQLMMKCSSGFPPSGMLRTDSGRTISISAIDAIYYRRPEQAAFPDSPAMTETSRAYCIQESSAAINGFLRLADCYWMNDPQVTRSAEVKPLQLRTAIQCGFTVPRTLITNDVDEARAFIEAAPGRVLVKSVRSPRISESDSRIAYSHVLEDDEIELLDALKFAPCILQEYVPKHIEYRVTVVGHRVIAVAIHSQERIEARVDWRRADYRCVRHELQMLPDDVAESCLRFAQLHCLHFAAIDLIRKPDGEYVFLECNPNGEWAWLEDAANARIASAVADALLAR